MIYHHLKNAYRETVLLLNRHADEFIKRAEKQRCHHCDSYNNYIAEEKAAISKYAADNGTTKPFKAFFVVILEGKFQLARSTSNFITRVQQVFHT